MKNPIIRMAGTLVMAACTSITALADYNAAITALGPIAHWKLNESVQPPAADVAFNLGSLGDAGVGYYRGTSVHPASGAFTAGNEGGAAFDGTGNCMVFAPYLPSMHPAAPFTVEAWLSPANQNAAGALTCALSSGQFGSPRSGWLIYQADTGWNFRMYNENGLSTSANITGGGAPSAGAWYHLVATYDGTTVRLYVNGTESASANPTGYVPGKSGGLSIGGRSDGSFWWPGSADEVAVYPSVLTAAQVAEHYANGTSASPSQAYQGLVTAKNPLVYYRLGEASYNPPSILPVAANSGSLGTAAEGQYNPGMKVGVAGPRPPTQSGFPANNNAGDFNGSAGHVATGYSLNDVTEFTVVGWVRRGAIKSARGGYFGQNDLLEFGDADGGANVELWVNARGTNIKAAYPFADDEWGFFAITANATSTVLYANGVELGRLTGPVTSYGNNSFYFNIGGGGVFNATGDNFKGNIDEVAVFGSALTPAQLQALYFSANIAPKISRQPVAPSRTLFSGYTLNLSATASGTQPISYQWLRNGSPIGGQTSANLVLPGVTAAEAGAYVLRASNAYGSADSAAVNITVTPADSVAPVVLYAAGEATLNSVKVWFSEPLDPATAQNPANYSINGLAVTGAKLFGAPGTAGDNIVILSTATQPAGQSYALAVNGVNDQMLPATAVAPNSTVAFSSWVYAPGLIRFEHYDNIGSAADSGIAAGLADPRYLNGNPTTLAHITGRFDTRTVFPDDSHENYMAAMSGFITPTETDDYFFFVASDDASRVYLSANETAPNPAVDTPIAYELGCCGTFYEPDSGDTATTPNPIRLQAGKRYAILVLLKEGGGGDWLRLAWRKVSDPTPAADLQPISATHFATYVDPNVEVAFSKQPSNQVATLPSTAINFVNQSFSAGDGQFTVVNTEDKVPSQPWQYDAGVGAWIAPEATSGCDGPYNSRLISRAFTVPADQAVTLTFNHRYSFEADRWDGGQVLVSSNDSPFVVVPVESFIANGYPAGNIQGSGVLNGQRAFHDKSPGYDADQYVTSSAILGTFKAGDRVSVQFVCAWDDCSTAPAPNWVIRNVALSYSSPPTAVTFEAGVTATRQGNPTSFTYQWQRNDGAGFSDITGATGSTYRFFPTTQADLNASFRVVAGVPGKYITSNGVRVTEPVPTVIVGTPPSGFSGATLTNISDDPSTKTITADVPAGSNEAYLVISPAREIKSVQLVNGKLVIKY